MDEESLYRELVRATTTTSAASIIREYESGNDVVWVPLGGWDRKNNRGVIEVSGDPGRALVERVTNGIDAYIEKKHSEHSGVPQCTSPRDAAVAWMDVPAEGLSSLSQAARRSLANAVQVTLREGDSKDNRLVEIRDHGIGVSASDMPKSILSLNSDNKWRKHYLVGTYGQGGSSTLAASSFVFIASKKVGTRSVAFTVARFQDLPADEFKSGNYVYLTIAENVIEIDDEDFAPGTLIKHFGYDLSSYASPLGPRSVYGLLNTVLFDPLIPIWLNADEVFTYGRRVIKGARNALNGAVDEGDEGGRGPAITYSVPMYHAALGEFGRLGIEYWVLDPPDGSDLRKKIPIAPYVDDKQPIILTVNGQNQHEMPNSVVKKDAELLYLVKRLIVHVSCDGLTPEAKRILFTSTREEARTGRVLNAIRDEIVKALKSDPDLERLNIEARERSITEHQEESEAETKKEVARLLRMQGVPVTTGDVPAKVGNGHDGRTHGGRKPSPPPTPIVFVNPPTYIKLVWNDPVIPFYPGQRRYLRVETDAESHLHNSEDPLKSRTNFYVDPTGKLVICGTTPLKGGRLRVIVEATKSAAIGETARLCAEINRVGLSPIRDERQITVVEPPKSQPKDQALRIPDFEFREVASPDIELWSTLEWPEDVEKVAFSTSVESGKLIIFYSLVFPRFAKILTDFTKTSDAKGKLFLSRYKIWLLVYSLMEMRDEPDEDHSFTGKDQDVYNSRMREAMCRIANLAILFASQEVKNPQGIDVE